jgi:hypothetical protein
MTARPSSIDSSFPSAIGARISGPGQLRQPRALDRRPEQRRVVMGDQRAGDGRLDPLAPVDEGPVRDRAVRPAHAQAGVPAQVFHTLRAAMAREIVGAPDDHERDRRREAHRDHIGRDELAEADPRVEPAGREIDHLLARGDLQFDLRIGPGE